MLRKWYALCDGQPRNAQPPAVILAALADDLNTAQAIAEMHQIAQAGDGAELAASLRLLGLLGGEVPQWARAQSVDLSRYEAALGAARETAKLSKDFAPVDALKSALTSAGIEVRMTKEGVELIPAPGFDPAKLEGLL